MKDQEARQWVTLLAAHYPRVQLQQAHYDAYTRVVARYPAAGSAAVLDGLAARYTHWPSTAEIAQAFATAAVGAPLPTIAWEQVQAYVAYRPTMADCPACYGRGELPYGYAPGHREDAAEWRTCTACQGRCEVDTGTRPVLHPVAKRALDVIGGMHAVRSHEQPSILRSQYLRAYEDFLQLASQAAALGSPWQAALVAPTMPQLGAGG